MFESSQQGFALLTNLLEWSRSQTGKIVFEPEVINVKAVVDDVVSLMQFTATKKEISIQTNLPSDLFVYADKNMIKTVLRNLISNAIKFTYRGRSVKLTAHREDGTIAIAVIDNGIGMTEEVKQKLFRLEEECTTAGTEQEKGTGLGLALCREFMERNNGKITVDSRSGVGSTFTVFFPAPQVI